MIEVSGRTEDIHGNHTGYFYVDVELRDLFAAFALAGLISQSDRTMPTKVFAEEAYRCADAVLAQRTKEQQSQ